MSKQAEQTNKQQIGERPSRRQFIGSTGSVIVGSVVGGTLGSAGTASHAAELDLRGTGGRQGDLDQALRSKTFRLRTERAIANHSVPVPRHPDNDDEDRYANKIGTDTRGLPHNSRGEVDLAVWALLKQAVTTREVADFEKVQLGGSRKLVNPLGTLGVNLTGLSSVQFAVPSAPALASAERAADAVEVYWQSLLRDVPLYEFRKDTNHPLVRAAAADINRLSGYTGPRDASGVVTPDLLFRGTARYADRADPTGRSARHAVPPGVAVGPYISQFLLLDAPFGTSFIPALLSTQAPGNDFLTQTAEWLAVQDGKAPTRRITFDPVRRYLATGRDLAEVARGAPGFASAFQLLSTATSNDAARVGGLGTPLNPTNPYLKLKTSTGAAGSFAAGYVQGLLPLAVSRAIRSAYWQKWFVHRTLRPEAYGGLVHQRLSAGVDYPLHPDVLQSDAVARNLRKFGSHLISSAYPEGAPLHGSYPGGASVSAAVQATLLKAFFDENATIANPVQPDPADPTRLIPYSGPALTIGGELNKLATNLGVGRNWAGIHWRSDAAASLPLGEEVAIALLRDEKLTFKEPFEGFRFTRFDGSTVSL